MTPALCPKPERHQTGTYIPCQDCPPGAEAAKQAKDREYANEIIADHADADMSRAEIAQLLTANGIPQALAEQVAADMRPEEPRRAAPSIYAEQGRMLTEALQQTELPLQEFTRGDWDGWAGAEKPDGFEPLIGEIKVAGLPASQVDSVQWREEATLIVDASGITINFADTKDEGFAYMIHKPLRNFSLAVEVAKALRPEMKFNVLIALGFLRG